MMFHPIGKKACDPLRRRLGHSANAHLLSQRDRNLPESWSSLQSDTFRYRHLICVCRA
jgi:hypothetical protein